MNGNSVQGIVYCIILYTFKGIKTSTLTNLVPMLVKKGEHVTLHCLSSVKEWAKEEHLILLVDCNGNTVKVHPSYEMKLNVENQCQNLTIVNVSRSDGGIYQCSYDNSTYKFKVIVTYPPTVTEQDIVFHVGDINKNITCQVDGFPLNYVFGDWMHLSNDFEQIRTLTGTKDGTLSLPYQDGQSISYHDTGLYKCNVSNNIADQNGEIWQTGIVNVSVKGAPFLVRSNDIQRICLNEPIWYIEVHVLSVPQLTLAAWDKQSQDAQDSKPCSPTTIKTKMYGQSVHANGYRCSLGIFMPAIHTDYTLTLTNSHGKTTAVFTPRSKDASQMLNTTKKGQFYMDVRTTLSNKVNTENQECFTIEYQLEMCSTDEIPFSTKGAGYNNIGLMYGFGITGTAFLIITVLLGLFYRFKTVRADDSINDAVSESQDVPDVAISNDLYNSIADLNRLPAATGHHNDANVHNVNHLDESNIYQAHSASNDQNHGFMDNQHEHTLNYSEVTFDAKQTTAKFKIRGAESRTAYADIDICATENLRRQRFE